MALCWRIALRFFWGIWQ